MSSQISSLHRLPPLAAPELDRLCSRLEASLFRLARLVEAEHCSGEADEVIAASAVPALQAPASDFAFSKDPPPDRRKFPRREGHCRVAICRVHEDDWSLTPQQVEWRLHATPLKGRLDDLSLNGASVILPGPLADGEKVVLRLICPRRDHHLDQEAQIIRSQPAPDGQAEVKFHFTKRLSLEQVNFFSRFLSETTWI